MDEREYRETYHALNEQRCHFEKAINARSCACRHMHRFNLADREGVQCLNASAHRYCHQWLQQLREASRFALAQTTHAQALPHRLEAKLQAGGLLGLADLLNHSDDTQDIAALLEQALGQYGDVGNIPLPDVVDAVVAYEPRRRKQR